MQEAKMSDRNPCRFCGNKATEKVVIYLHKHYLCRSCKDIIRAILREEVTGGTPREVRVLERRIEKLEAKMRSLDG